MDVLGLIHKWFTFMHEMGHMLLHYNKNDTLITIEESVD